MIQGSGRLKNTESKLMMGKVKEKIRKKKILLTSFKSEPLDTHPLQPTMKMEENKTEKL